jgi:hypothetical protein
MMSPFGSGGRKKDCSKQSIENYKLRLWFEEDLDISIYELNFHPLLVEKNPSGFSFLLKEKERLILHRNVFVFSANAMEK